MSGGSEPVPVREADAEFQSYVRMAEALLFAAVEPLDEATLKARLPTGAVIADVVDALTRSYANRGVNLVEVGGKWTFRTAPDLKYLLEFVQQESRRLSKAAVETLAIVAYHQPVTRAEIEEIRGVSISKGTLDLLIEAGWAKIAGRKRTPGRPVTYGTTEAFLEHFSLKSVDDLPGIDELKATGLLEVRIASNEALGESVDGEVEVRAAELPLATGHDTEG